MPDFNVYAEQAITVKGTTRTVLVPSPANPVTAADADSAIKAGAAALKIEAVYQAVDVATDRKAVTFDNVPVLSAPPA